MTTQLRATPRRTHDLLFEKVTSKNVKRYSEEIVKNKPIKKKVIKSKDGKVRIKYALTISLLPEHLQIRVRRYKDDVINESKRFKIDPAMVLAIMHTESSFNPKAESPVPAYGLMQLVPKTGARDAYLYVYNKDKLLTANYLFNPKNNIELGCAYLKKIRSVYFKDIKNDLSATYCMIAAYNTGPGNLAKAFTGNKKLSPAIREINALSPNEVYLKLVNDLTHKESRSYLKKVTSRIKGTLGYADSYGDEIYPFFKNYTAGGSSSVRGYKQGSIGAKVYDAGYGDYVTYGGQKKLTFSAETFFPVPGMPNSESFRMSAFLDGGGVFEDSFNGSQMRYSAGIGATWLSPFGPLNISLSAPLNDNELDKTEKFQFGMGTNF